MYENFGDNLAIDEKIYSQLWVQYKGFIKKLAFMFCQQYNVTILGIDEDDVISLSQIEMIKAWKVYDLNRNYKFITLLGTYIKNYAEKSKGSD